MSQKVKVIMIAFVSLGLVACGQGMTTKSSSSSSEKTLNTDPGVGSGDVQEPAGGDDTNLQVPFDVRKVTGEVEAQASRAIDEANAAASEAEKYLNRIKLGGGRLEVTNTGASQQLIVDKAIKKALDKILEKIKKSPEMFDQLRAKLADRVASLDSSNPLHQSAIAALMVAMGKIDTLEARFGDLMERLEGAMDVVIGRLETLVSAVPFPVSLLVAIEWADVKAVLREFQNSLRNL